MIQPNGRRGTLYEQVLEFARKEIDEASSKLSELRQTLRLLEARVEAAKSVYESVAARLNLEDELEDGADFQEPIYEAPTPVQAPEPPEEPEPVEPPDNGNQEGFSAELVRRHLERQAQRSSQEEVPLALPEPSPEPEPVAESVAEAPLMQPEREQEQSPAEPPNPSDGESPPSNDTPSSGFPGLSVADRQLIGEYLRAKRGG